MGKRQAGEFVSGAIRRILSGTTGRIRPARTTERRSAPLDIAIPIHGNAALLKRCLDALLPTLSAGDRVWLVDDFSEQAEIDALLREFSNTWPDTRCLKNDRNLGFTGSCNRVFRLTDRDIVLLNSDTEPGQGWLEQLQACLDRNPRAGIVCPVSDHATLLSALPAAPPPLRENIVEKAASFTAGDIPIPTAVGFCMLIRRELLDEIGGFCRLFDPGYGEENDFSMRALRAGWRILAADRASVFHDKGSGSFSEERSREIKKKHQAMLERIWPEYTPLVQSWWRVNPLRTRTERLAGPRDTRPGVLHVLHRQSLIGGTERVTRTLVGALTPRYDQSMIYPGLTHNPWCDLEPRPAEGFRELMVNQRWIRPSTRISGHGADLSCRQSERTLAQVIAGSEPHIVHFHHMLHWDSLMLPALAKALGCRTVISVHDFWFQCPQYNQIEFARGLPCRRVSAVADDRCSNCLAGHAGPSLDARHYLPARQSLMENMLEAADAMVVPSGFIRDKLTLAFPGVDPGRIHLVPHGVELPEGTLRKESGPDRVVAFLGGDQPLKGAGLVLETARMMKNFPVTFRIHGRTRSYESIELPANVELAGFYRPDEVGETLKGVDLVLIPSFFEESYSLVASECWAHGIPVLCSRSGALGERVKPGVNGWLAPDMKPESWAKALARILGGDELERCLRRIADDPVTGIGQSSGVVHRLYQALLDRPPLPTPRVEGGKPLSRFDTKVRQLQESAGSRAPAGQPNRCLGIVRNHWGPANYRVRFPLEDLQRSGVTDACAMYVTPTSDFGLDEILETHRPKKILIQPYLSDRGMRLMESLHREPGLEVTLVIDDLWTAVPAQNPVSSRLPRDVHERLRHISLLSDCLVFTTDPLREALSVGHDNAHVIPNALPEWIWNAGMPAKRQRSGKPRIGWAGATQHGGDLAFLNEVVRATEHAADWVFLGMCPETLLHSVHDTRPMVPFEKYPGTLAALNIDLAIAPLADNAFNRCKSQLKILEYGILGIPSIAADLDPYRQAPVPRARSDDPAEWIARIEELLADEARRTELGTSLRNWVLENHMSAHRRPDWAKALGIDIDVG